MKKMMITLTVMLLSAATGKAMSYEQARNEALFLTDKMAYELNLSDEQYEAAYEINLDYLMGVTCYDDVYGPYWEHRNQDLSYILLDWQWNAFCAASYFYRPLYWRDGFWHFGVYARYPHRDYFYFGRPVFYATYRGAHAWHIVGGHGFYHPRREHFRPAVGRSHFGMLDRWNRGDYNSHHERHTPNGSHFGGNRNSSTRTTAGNAHHDSGHNAGSGRSLGGYRSQNHGGNSSTGSYRSQNSGSNSSTGGSRMQGGVSSSTGSSAGSGRSLGGSRSSGDFSHGGTTRSSASSSRSSAGRSGNGGHSYGGRR